MEDKSPEFVSINKACEIVSVSRRTIYNWLKAGKLETKRTAGGAIRISRTSLFIRQDVRNMLLKGEV